MARKCAFFDGVSYLIYRLIPEWEFLKWYTERKKEIFVDGEGWHWLCLTSQPTEELALLTLRTLTCRGRCVKGERNE